MCESWALCFCFSFCVSPTSCICVLVVDHRRTFSALFFSVSLAPSISSHRNILTISSCRYICLGSEHSYEKWYSTCHTLFCSLLFIETQTYFNSKFNGNYVRYARMCLSMCIYMVFFFLSLYSFFHNSAVLHCYSLLYDGFWLPAWCQQKKKYYTLRHMQHFDFSLSAFFAFGPLNSDKFRMRTQQNMCKRMNDATKWYVLLLFFFLSRQNEYPIKRKIWTKFKIHTNRSLFFSHFISWMCCWMTRCIIWTPQLFDFERNINPRSVHAYQ